jgi:hypothetical protein
VDALDRALSEEASETFLDTVIVGLVAEVLPNALRVIRGRRWSFQGREE